MIGIIHMYYVYQLLREDTPIYVGMSKNPKRRFKQHLGPKVEGYGHGYFEGQIDLQLNIVKGFDTMSEALKEEGRLKLLYGMRWTERDHVYTDESRKARSEGGKKGGKNSHKNGSSPKQLAQLARVRNPQKAADSRKRISCIHCGKEGLTGNINRWHNDNCKLINRGFV